MDTSYNLTFKPRSRTFIDSPFG